MPGSPAPYSTVSIIVAADDRKRFVGTGTTWSETGRIQAALPSTDVTRGTKSRNSGSTYDRHTSGDTSVCDAAETTS